MTPLVRRLALAAGLGGVAFGAVGALVHVPAARPLLVRLGVPCPVRTVAAADVARLHSAGLAALRGDTPAPARPALVFGLDAWRVEDGERWAARTRVACERVVRGYVSLRCHGVPAAALGEPTLPPASELWLSFGADGLLNAVDVYRRGMAPDTESRVWEASTAALRRTLGAPTHAVGTHSTEELATPLHLARVQYRFTDYVATVTASNVPWAGLGVRAQYLSARSPL